MSAGRANAAGLMPAACPLLQARCRRAGPAPESSLPCKFCTWQPLVQLPGSCHAGFRPNCCHLCMPRCYTSLAESNTRLPPHAPPTTLQVPVLQQPHWHHPGFLGLCHISGEARTAVSWTGMRCGSQRARLHGTSPQPPPPPPPPPPALWCGACRGAGCLCSAAQRITGDGVTAARCCGLCRVNLQEPFQHRSLWRRACRRPAAGKRPAFLPGTAGALAGGPLGKDIASPPSLPNPRPRACAPLLSNPPPCPAAAGVRFWD